jgi:polar amino acid transport system substrate-binding protein
MAMLDKNRVGFILYERWQGLWHTRNLNMKVQAHEPPLAKREMFMYLHKKHVGLVEKAVATLAEIKKDGTYKK